MFEHQTQINNTPLPFRKVLCYIQMENYQYILIKDIHTNPYQPRKDFSIESLNELANLLKRMINLYLLSSGNHSILDTNF